MSMIIKGKFNEAKIYTDIVEQSALAQIQDMCDNELFEGCRIRIMPDVHTGKSCTIGTTMTVRDKVIPNMVGVDIGCGMEVVRIEQKNIDLARFDAAVYERIPSGTDVCDEPHKYARRIDLKKLRCYSEINEYRSERSVGTLGGGNHFIEIDRDDEGKLYIVVHS